MPSSVRAKTVITSATLASVMKHLRPFRRQPASVRVARVRSAAASEPASGSVSANEHSHSPLASRGSSSAFCASVPNSSTGPAPRYWLPSSIPLFAQQRAICSQTSVSVSRLPSSPPYSGGATVAKTSWARNSSRTSCGNSPRASISAARGLRWCSASSRTPCAISFIRLAAPA